MNEIKQFDISNRLYLLAGILFAAIVFFIMIRMIADYRSLPENFPREITVTAEGSVFVEPDIAMLTVGLTSEGLETGNLVKDNAKKMNDVIDAVKGMGIEETDIQTAKYNLYPRYDYKDGERIFKGYTLNQEVFLKIRDFDKIDKIISLSTEKGANLVGEIRFTIDDEEAVKEEAIKEAIGKAKEKAKFIADEAGFTLVKVINFFEETEPMPLYGIGGAKTKLDVDGEESPSIEHGEQEIVARVGLTYRIK
ncbi:MAG: SIMPL domain-containing protein [bacterium]